MSTLQVMHSCARLGGDPCQLAQDKGYRFRCVVTGITKITASYLADRLGCTIATATQAVVALLVDSRVIIRTRLFGDVHLSLSNG